MKRLRAFTLIELMIAVAVLLVVIVATSQIFGTASRVTGMGNAAASVMQEAAVIERMMRDDIARLSTEGFFAIRQVAVENNVNLDDTGRLLNPLLPDHAIIRADQLVFFANGVEQPQTARINKQGRTRGQGLISRVYYGHGFQLPMGQPYDWQSIYLGFTYDAANHVFPWHRGNVQMNRTENSSVGSGQGTGTNIFSVSSAGTLNATQPFAQQWLLVRQPVVLVDDDRQDAHTNSKTVYLGEIATERSIFLRNFNITGVPGYTNEFWARQIRAGRLDGAATRLHDVKRRIQLYPNGEMRPWYNTVDGQRDYISEYALYYPRAERVAPGPHRPDQALTNHVIGSAVSNFIVEWTYSDGVGDMYDAQGRMLCTDNSGSGGPEPCDSTYNVPYGFRTNWLDNPLQPEQPWFGLNRIVDAGGSDFTCGECTDRGVGFYGFIPTDDYDERANFKRILDINGDAVQTMEYWRHGHDHLMDYAFSPDYGEIHIYEAIFGYNRTVPTVRNESTEQLEPAPDYTPWPTAIRVTMTLHDPQGRLENGREFQFVIELPKRVRE